MALALLVVMGQIRRVHTAISKAYMAIRCQGLPQERVALPLLVVMAQQRRRIPRDTDSPHLKLIAELYDKCDIVLLQVRARAVPARMP